MLYLFLFCFHTGLYFLHVYVFFICVCYSLLVHFTFLYFVHVYIVYILLPFLPFYILGASACSPCFIDLCTIVYPFTFSCFFTVHICLQIINPLFRLFTFLTFFTICICLYFLHCFYTFVLFHLFFVFLLVYLV